MTREGGSKRTLSSSLSQGHYQEPTHRSNDDYDDDDVDHDVNHNVGVDHDVDHDVNCDVDVDHDVDHDGNDDDESAKAIIRSRNTILNQVNGGDCGSAINMKQYLYERVLPVKSQRG